MGNDDDRYRLRPRAVRRGRFPLRARPLLRRRRPAHRPSLDTSVSGYHHGEISDAQYEWLASVLAEPAPHGTFLAMHHPPIPVPMLPAAAIIELDDQPRLAEALAGTDVRMILGGHFHYSSYSTFAGIPVSVASATCYLSDIAPKDRFISAIDAEQSVNMVHVYGDSGRHLGRPDARLRRDQRVRHRRRAAGRGPVLRRAPRDVLPQGLRLQPPRGETRSSAPRPERPALFQGLGDDPDRRRPVLPVSR